MRICSPDPLPSKSILMFPFSDKAGDRICIFGFSRGAYTARGLAGMIHKVRPSIIYLTYLYYFDIVLISRWDCCQLATTSRYHSHTRCTRTQPKKDGSNLVHSKKHSRSMFRSNSSAFGMAISLAVASNI